MLRSYCVGRRHHPVTSDRTSPSVRSHTRRDGGWRGKAHARHQQPEAHHLQRRLQARRGHGRERDEGAAEPQYAPPVRDRDDGRSRRTRTRSGASPPQDRGDERLARAAQGAGQVQHRKLTASPASPAVTGQLDDQSSGKGERTPGFFSLLTSSRRSPAAMPKSQEEALRASGSQKTPHARGRSRARKEANVAQILHAGYRGGSSNPPNKRLPSLQP